MVLPSDVRYTGFCLLDLRRASQTIFRPTRHATSMQQRADWWRCTSVTGWSGAVQLAHAWGEVRRRSRAVAQLLPLRAVDPVTSDAQPVVHLLGREDWQWTEVTMLQDESGRVGLGHSRCSPLRSVLTALTMLCERLHCHHSHTIMIALCGLGQTERPPSTQPAARSHAP